MSHPLSHPHTQLAAPPISLESIHTLLLEERAIRIEERAACQLMEAMMIEERAACQRVEAMLFEERIARLRIKEKRRLYLGSD